MSNLVRQRHMQVFFDGVLKQKLDMHEKDKDPTFLPIGVDEDQVGSVIEAYDSTVSLELVVRGRMSLEKKNIYACFIMGDAND